MRNALTLHSGKRVKEPAYSKLKTALMTAALLLVSATAAPQLPASQVAADKRALFPEAAHPERPEEAIELTTLLRERRQRPLVDRSLPPTIKYRLSTAYEVAIGQLRSSPACASLFRQLGTDGEALLARIHYYDAGEAGVCRERVRAFTTVGSTRIKLCRSFGDLQPSSAAMLLIHEALHSAGLRESPAYPNAMTADEINAAVSQACRLW